MIELRPFAKLGGADHGWLKAKHHFSFASHYDPENMGHGVIAGLERRRDRAEHRLSRPSPCQHGDHHLCPRRRDHPPGQARQQGPHRSRRRAGDERRNRHPPLRIQSRAGQDEDLPDLDRADHAGRPADLGRKAVSRSPTAPASSSPSPAAFEGDDGCAADPRRCAGARHHAEGRREREYTPAKQRHLYLVPAAGAVEVNGVRVNARDGVAIRDEAALKITALEDSELVLVDAA